MSFHDDIQRAVANVRRRERQLFFQSQAHAWRSIRFGSPVTGAPGQPVQRGVLLRGWYRRMNGTRNIEFLNDEPHAEPIEHNRRGAMLLSAVGGFHSVLRTRLGWRAIVRYELARLGQPVNEPSIGRPSVGRNPQQRSRRGRFGYRKAARLEVRSG